MQDTKALRPEIKGLFETIKNQAIKYSEAFELLDYHRSEYERYIKELKSLYDEIYVSTGNEMFQLRQKYDDLTKILKVENSKISRKYSELKDLKQLQDSYFSALESIKSIQTSLESQYSMLKKGSDDFNEKIQDIKNSANSKVDEFISVYLDKIDDTLKSQNHKFEDKINNKLRLIEGKIINNDEIYFAFQEKYKSDIKKVLDEFDKTRRNLSEQENYPLGDKENITTLVRFKNELNEKVNNIEENFEVIRNKIESLDKTIDRFSPVNQDKHSTVPQTITTTGVSSSDVLIKKLQSQISELRNKTTLANTIAYISIGIALLTLILLFVL
ncbi:MAG: hypothetical protein WC313_10170 [Candidatus Kapaibacterium sp.]|jgi:chromosome segregation ATPase|nr:hypothetical protein [Candidatus Kapabacteria bacterium]